jgi:uncharacterized delta-60 repeat protein
MKRKCCFFGLVFLSAVFPSTQAWAGDCQPVSYFLEQKPLPARFPGSPDLSFNPRLALDLDGEISAAAVQPDGKVIIAGAFTWVRGVHRESIARVNADGSLDTSFDAKELFNREDRFIVSLLVQRDGKILVDDLLLGALRLNADGSLDASFRPEIEHFRYSRYLLAVQDDSKVILSPDSAAVRRLNADGTLDASFHSPALPDGSYLHAVTEQADGKLLIAGRFTNVDGITRVGLARLNHDGSLDATFDSPNLAPSSSYSVLSIALQRDGRIVASAQIHSLTEHRSWIVRLNQDGSLDPTFSLAAQVTSGWFQVQAVDEGKLLVSGGDLKVDATFTALARLNADGSLDPSFDTTSSGLSLSAVPPLPAGNGKVVFANSGVSRGIALGRLDSSGFLDSSFLPLKATVWEVSALAVQPDGRILTGGLFAGPLGAIPTASIKRFNADGSLDPNFNVGDGITASRCGGEFTAIALQPDGKILVSGDFTSFNNLPHELIVRLNPDGSLDDRFHSAFNVIDEGPVFGCDAVNSLAVQVDGKILVAGQFGTDAQTNRPGIARLNPDGGLDLSFQPDFPASGMAVSSVVVQPDQQIVIGGSDGLYRLNIDGSLDMSFRDGTAGSGLGRPAIALQPDGKLLLAGNSAYFGGISRDGLARLNSDGTLDPTFQAPLIEVQDCSPWIFTVGLQQNGKIVISGDFSSIDGTPRFGIARLHSDGSLDTGFDTGTGLMAYRQPSGASAIAFQSDGGVLIGGQFTSVNGGSSAYVARLFGGEVLTILPQSLRRLPTGGFQFEAAGPTNQAWFIQATTDLAAPNWTAIATNTMGLESLSFTDSGAAHIPSRYYRAVFSQ